MKNKDGINDSFENTDNTTIGYTKNYLSNFEFPMSNQLGEAIAAMSKNLLGSTNLSLGDPVVLKSLIESVSASAIQPVVLKSLIESVSASAIQPVALKSLLESVSASVIQPVALKSLIESALLPKIEFPKPLLDDFLPLELSERYNAIREKLELLDGYHEETFLPVYRIGLDDDLTEDNLVKSVIANKSKIFEFAKSTATLIEYQKDPLTKAFLEVIGAAEAGFEMPAQAAASTLLSFIREHRIDTVGVKNQKTVNSSITVSELEDFFEAIENDYAKEDIFLISIFVYVYQNTGKIDKNPHDPTRVVNRNASVHKNITYYSEYISLAFILYLSEVFQLIHRAQGEEKSIVKDPSLWEA